MDRDKFIKEQNNEANLKARADNIKLMSKLITSQTELCRAYNLEKKIRLQIKYKETKDRLLISPRINKRYG